MKTFKNIFIIYVLILLFILSGCSGRYVYYPPINYDKHDNSIIIDKSKDDVWKMIIPAIGKNFFIINNLDKESGIINISYNGDPEKYVDCGCVESYVRNAAGERIYKFPAAIGFKEYEIMDMNQNGGRLLYISRKLNLEGRMNVIIEEVDKNKTRLTVNTRYILNRTGYIKSPQYPSNQISDTISFNTNDIGDFNSGTKCVSNGKFENEILSLLIDIRK